MHDTEHRNLVSFLIFFRPRTRHFHVGVLLIFWVEYGPVCDSLVSHSVGYHIHCYVVSALRAQSQEINTLNKYIKLNFYATF
jgi:hypothetical protein